MKHTISCTQSHIFWPKPSIFSACGREEGEISVQKKRKKGGVREWEGGGSSPARKRKLFCWYYKVLGLKLEDEGEGFRHICVYSFAPCTSIPSAVHVFFMEIWDLRPWYISNHWNLGGGTFDMEKCCHIAAHTVDSCYFSFSSRFVLDVSLWACSTTLPLLPLKVHCMFVKFRDLMCKHQIAGDLQWLQSRCTETHFVSEVKGTRLERSISDLQCVSWFSPLSAAKCFLFVILSFFPPSTTLLRVKLYPATSSIASTGTEPPMGKLILFPLLPFLSGMPAVATVTKTALATWLLQRKKTRESPKNVKHPVLFKSKQILILV